MISAITGELKRVDDERAHVQSGAMLFELLVPAVDVLELQARLNEEVTLHTILYLQGDGNSFEPQLIGFLRMDDKRFFEKFITVKGIGPRTALRALTVPIAQIAHAIETKDTRPLTQLKGIGKRTAELIVAELSGKVQAFVSPGISIAKPAPTKYTAEDEAAIAVLASPQMGLRRPDAERLLLRVKEANPTLKTADELVPEMLRQHARS
jgi:Holliday junction DNA helicase RuvA